MDGRSPPSDRSLRPGSLPSSPAVDHSSEPSSIIAQEIAQDPGDHIDSPMRKKPRLDATPLPFTMPAQHDPPSTPERKASNAEQQHDILPPSPPAKPSEQTLSALEPLPTSQTPSKVTLNLRSTPTNEPSNNASHADASYGPEPAMNTEEDPPDAKSADRSSMLSQTQIGNMERDSSDTEVMNVTTASPEPSSGGSVVEIQVDTMEDGEDSFGPFHSSVSPEAEMLNRFPFVEGHGYVTALKSLANAAGDGSIVDYHVLKDITNWLQEWLEQCGQYNTRLRNIYLRDHDFWSSFGVFFARYLGRRSLNATSLPPGTTDQGRLRFLVDLLGQCIHLHHHLLLIDLDKADLTTGPLPFLMSLKTTKALDIMFQGPQDVPLWLFLTQKHQINVHEIQRRLGSIVLSCHSSMPETMARLALLMAQRDLILSPRIDQEVARAIRLTVSLHKHVRLAASEALLRPKVMNVEKNTDIQQKLIATTESRLQHELSKQTTWTCEDSLSIGHLIGDLVFEISFWSSEAMESLFRREFGSTNIPKPSVAALLNQKGWITRVFWSFVLKGRMELRVGAVSTITKELLDIFQKITNFLPDSIGSSTILAPLARNFVKRQVVEYIVGPESHPQIISRSRDILAFIMVTNNWNRDHTEAVWATVTSSSDPRIVHATLDLLIELTHNLPADTLVLLCENMANLPLKSFNGEMCRLTNQLLHKMVSNKTGTEELQLIPFRSCIRFFNRITHTENVSRFAAESFYGFLCETINSLAQFSLETDQRKTLYRECIFSIQSRDQYCQGSVEILLAVLRNNTEPDLAYLNEEVNLFHVIAEETCAFVDDLQGKLASPAVQLHLTSRLKLVLAVLFWQSEHTSTQDTELKLWDHLFDNITLEVAYRETAWHQLAALANSCQEPKPFVDRCVDRYLPSISPECFSPGLFLFVQAAMRYIQSTRQQERLTQNEDNKLDIPLVDLLWTIFITAPQNTIEVQAGRLLSEQHLETPLIKEALLTSVTLTHTNLVNRCIESLKKASQEIQDVSATQINTSHTRGAPLHPRARFHRILQFLRTFTQEVNARPQFLKQPQEENGVSSQSWVSSENSDDLATIKFEAFGPGLHGGQKKEIEISKYATFSELKERISDSTGFKRMRFIGGGRPLDLSDRMEERITDFLSNGYLSLLLVRDISSTEDEKSSSTSVRSRSVSAATMAILEQYDAMFAFLDLEEGIATDVFSFLMEFPPPNDLKSMIISSTISTEKDRLFSPGKHLKNLYHLKSIQNLLTEQQGAGSVTETFVAKSVELLMTILTDNAIIMANPETRIERGFLSGYFECLLSYIREKSTARSLGECIRDTKGTSDQLYSLLLLCKDDTNGAKAELSFQIYACAVEASVYNRKLWESFSSHNSYELHYWLLCVHPSLLQRESIRFCIERVCEGVHAGSVVKPNEFTNFYWQILSKGIPRLIQSPLQSRQLLMAATTIFPLPGAFVKTESTVRDYFVVWSDLLSHHSHVERPGQGEVDDVVLGMAKLLLSCLGIWKSFKKPIHEFEIAKMLFSKYLFPSPPNQNSAALRSNQACLAVLDSETRKELYGLVAALCNDELNYLWLTETLSDIHREDSQTKSLLWNTDRSKWFRSFSGYAGLRNLTNTCYMNSLLSQLFMNKRFRDFMLHANAPDSSGTQRLLSETKELFGRMQNGVSKYVDTESFAAAIRPYDSDSIDITIQMDVDEFHNLLFDRWEGQILSPEEKQKFRSFYGGQLVNQVKSMDCDHISERYEPFLTIQCDVKGKVNLAESLKSFVEGDFMEGDNKYKCESCHGKLVNAVKRTCFKELPDNIIFHLKRFDFDLTTFQRNKINDRFEFSSYIDMQRYKLESLEGSERREIIDDTDIFELVGVLVHSGNAESGHYYSFVRIPSNDGASFNWIEVNDTDVTSLDRDRLVDQSMGGVLEHPRNNLQVSKSYNAYMLFYQRTSSIQSYGNYRPPSQPSASDSTMYEDLVERIFVENEACVRRCLLSDSNHTRFIQRMLSSSRNLNSGSCSDDHILEERILEIALTQLLCTTTRLKETVEFESFALAVKRFATSCFRCSNFVVDWITSRPNLFEESLVLCPFTKIRSGFGDFLIGVLQSLRNSDTYAVDHTESSIESLEWTSVSSPITRVVSLAKLMTPDLWKNVRAWDDFFEFLVSIGNLGTTEVAVLLCEGFLEVALELLLADSNLFQRRYTPLASARELLTRSKKPPSLHGAVKLISLFFKRINLFSRSCGFDWRDYTERLSTLSDENGRFPISYVEELAISHWDDHHEHLSFLAKVMEIVDGHETANYAEEIVTHIISALVSANRMDDESFGPKYYRFLNKMAITITNAVNEYYPNAAGPILKCASVFCLLTEDVDDISNIFDSVVRNVIAMEQPPPNHKVSVNGICMEFPTQNTQDHLDFFRGLALKRDPESLTSKLNGNYYIGQVIQTIPTWAPLILLYENKSTRGYANATMGELIFKHCNNLQATEDSPASRLTALRTSVVVALFGRCFQLINIAFAKHYSKTLLEELYITCKQCAAWIQKMNEASKEQESHLQRQEHAEILIRFSDLQDRWQDWIEPDLEEGGSGTEDPSNEDSDGGFTDL